MDKGFGVTSLRRINEVSVRQYVHLERYVGVNIKKGSERIVTASPESPESKDIFHLKIRWLHGRNRWPLRKAVVAAVLW